MLIFISVVWCDQSAVVRQVLRKELGLKIVEVGSDTAVVEGGYVLWTGSNFKISIYFCIYELLQRQNTIKVAHYALYLIIRAYISSPTTGNLYYTCFVRLFLKQNFLVKVAMASDNSDKKSQLSQKSGATLCLTCQRVLDGGGRSV